MQLTRRTLIAGAAAGGGLVLAWYLIPRAYPSPLTAGRAEHVFDAWLKIGEDSVVTVAVPQLEMGQGVTTLLPQVVAQELGADWRQVAVEPAPVSGAYPNVPLAEKWIALWDPPAHGLTDASDGFLARRFAEGARFNVTADGTALAAYEIACREAGAAARAMLAEEAASRWDVQPEACIVEGGIVQHGANRATFGELAAGAALREPPDPPPLRPEEPAAQELPDIADAPPLFPRIDLPSKVDGSFQFAGDVRLPGMVYAAIRHGPNHGAELAGFDKDGARAVRGVVGAVRAKRWLAVAADTWWSAERALDAMRPQFRLAYPADSQTVSARLSTMVEGGPAHRVAETGFGEEAMARIDLARRYEIEAAPAAPLETASAAARFENGRLDLWMASQAPESARSAAARALGIATEDVALYPMPAGGSFDARLEHDHAIEIAVIARELERPVQLTWSRREEMTHARPRSPAHVLLGAQLSGEDRGDIDALRVRIAAPPAMREFGARLFDNLRPEAAIRASSGRPDPLACEGAVPSYRLPSVVVDHVPVETGLPVGRVRGNAHTISAFALESFIDEVAHGAGREPFSYRMGMLGDDIRLAACLQRAAQLAEWGGGLDQSGQGLACHRIGDPVTGGRIACVATARAGEGGVRVARIVAVVDIGRVVNPDIARQQIEGGLVFGIGIALGNAQVFRSGVPQSFDYASLGLPALVDCPEITVDFIASAAEPADPGELGAIIAPPAIANALFSATGLRLRRLPLLSEGF